jgi:formylglycine-generating enzyme required for sulfatase activity
LSFLKKIFKYLFVLILAGVLVSVSIDAADNYDNLSQSIIGRLVLGEPDGPCPKDMVFISTDNNGFCIDKYENSPGQDCLTLAPSSQEDSRNNLNESGCQPVSEEGRIPWRFVSQIQAAALCAKAGKRLPSGEEWFQASLGTPDKNQDWTKSDCQIADNWDRQPGEAGSAADCVSSAGAYDMIGNVWEWVKGETDEGVYNGKVLPNQGYIIETDINGIPTKVDQDNPDPNFNEDYLWIKNTEVRGMARGGYWNNKIEGGLFSLYLVSSPAYAGTGIGFRCAK